MTASHSIAADRREARKWVFIAVIASLLLGLMLRGWRLHGTGYSSDEIAELTRARAPIADIVMDRDDDRFPPLHRTAMALWNRMWGDDAAARWLSVACGALALIVVWRAGAELFGERDAVWPTLILACSPFHLVYSRDGRAYSMYILFTAIMFWAALRLLRDGSWRNWAMLIGSTAAAVYTHYYAAPLGFLLWCIVLPAAILRDGWRRPVAASLAMTLFLAPAPVLLWLALHDMHDEKLVAWFDVEELGFAYVSLAAGYTVGPSINELRSMPTSEGIRQFVPWILAVGFAYATLGWQALGCLPRAALIVLLLPMLALVPALGVIGNWNESGFVVRYVSWMVIPYALVLGAGASRWRGRPIVVAAIVILLAVNGVAIYNRRYDPRYADEDFRAVAEKLWDMDDRNQPILVASNYIGTALQYYLDEKRPIASFSIFSHHAADRDAAIAEFLSQHPTGTEFWIVSQWLPEDDVRRATRDAELAKFHAKLVEELNQAQIYSAVVP